MKSARKQLNCPEESIGFVPTMGALHDGHLSLIETAASRNDNVVVSIFINPKQFSAGEDFDKYPRQLESDLKTLSKILKNRIRFVFAPSEAEMYPSKALCHVEPAAFSSIYEGRQRPDFFRGVATVVTKLFNIVRPTEAYFGQKDISQCILLRRMVEDLDLSTKIRVCASVREPDGLAMSSRNAYLSEEERKAASILFRALSNGKTVVEASLRRGGQPVLCEDIKQIIEQTLRTEPLVRSIEYISLAEPSNMAEVTTLADSGGGLVISSAIRLGSVRLIDNVLVGSAETIVDC